jgi:hypothetical protein
MKEDVQTPTSFAENEITYNLWNQSKEAQRKNMMSSIYQKILWLYVPVTYTNSPMDIGQRPTNLPR